MCLFFWEVLPESLLFHVVAYAAPPTHRAAVICQQLAPLCQSSYRKLLHFDPSPAAAAATKNNSDNTDADASTEKSLQQKKTGKRKRTRQKNEVDNGTQNEDSEGTHSVSSILWDAILKEDYGVTPEDSNAVVGNGATTAVTTTTTRQSSASRKRHQPLTSRRSSRRLQRSPVHRVRDFHVLMKEHTDIAYFYLSELCNVSSSSKEKLSRSKLCRILEEYGPHLRLNQVLKSGGTFLVELCRAKHVKETTIFYCIQELVQHRGLTELNTTTQEATNSQLTALCVAAVRAMPKVCAYLLQHGAIASLKIPCSGRFRLQSQPKKSIQCKQTTPILFAKAMLHAEQQLNCPANELKSLQTCIHLLAQAEHSRHARPLVLSRSHPSLGGRL